MNFKRPCWVAIYTTMGMTLAGYCGFLSMPSDWAAKTADGWRLVIGLGIYFLLMLGAIGFAVSLIWCLVVAIASRSRSDYSKS
jgi:hypothetical protein